MSGQCFVQDRYVQQWLFLAKWDHKKNQWIYPKHTQRIPYEETDTRFLFSLRYLEYGYKLYKIGAKLGKDYPISVAPELIDQGVKLWESNPFSHEKTIDVNGFWSRLDLGEEPKLTKKEQKRQSEIKAKKTITEIWNRKKDELIPANSWLAR